MDIITICDGIAVLLALVVASKTNKSEGILLFAFFATSSFISYFIFGTEMYQVWPMVFAMLIVTFGLLSLHHIVIMGYIAHLVIVGLNQRFDIIGYSAYIYGIFAFQLLAVRYGHNLNYYRSLFSHSSSSIRHKIKTH